MAQYILIVASLVLAALAGILLTPALGRNAPPDALIQVAEVVTAIGVVAGLNICRPVIVRQIALRNSDSNRLWGYIAVSVGMSIVTQFVCFGYFRWVSDHWSEVGAVLLISLALGTIPVAYCLLAILEGYFGAGTAQLAKSLSTFAFYCILISLALASRITPVALAGAVLLTMGTLVLASFVSVYKKIEWKPHAGTDTKRLLETAVFSVVRVPVDFGDRAIIWCAFGPTAFAAYTLLQEAIARVNLPLQYMGKFAYKPLCASHGDGLVFQAMVRRYFLTGCVYFFCVCAVAFAAMFFEPQILQLMFGGRQIPSFGYTSLLFLAAAVQGLNLVSQTVIRAAGEFGRLNRAFLFNLPVAGSLAALAVYCPKHEIVVLSIIVLKSAGLSLFASLADLSFPSIIGRMTCIFIVSAPAALIWMLSDSWWSGTVFFVLGCTSIFSQQLLSKWRDQLG